MSIKLNNAVVLAKVYKHQCDEKKSKKLHVNSKQKVCQVYGVTPIFVSHNVSYAGSSNVK